MVTLGEGLWKKYTKSIPEAISYLPIIMREFLEMAEKRCAQCISDRIICYLKPMCEERITLEILIKLGVPREELPSLCYNIFLQRFASVVKKSYPETLINRTVYSDDLMSFFPKKLQELYKKGAYEKFANEFSKYLKNFYTFVAYKLGSGRLWFACDENLILFDLKQNITILNPDGILKAEIFDELLALFARAYDLYYSAEEELPGSWVFNFEFPPKETDINKYIDKLRSLTGYASWYVEDKLIITLEISLTSLTINKFTEVLRILNKIKKLVES